MAAIGVPMPSMAPGPSPPASMRTTTGSPGLQPQAIPQNFSSSNHSSQNLSGGMSGLSLALPLSSSTLHGASPSVSMPTPLSSAPPATVSPLTSSALSHHFTAPLETASPLSRIKLIDILPEDGAPSAVYIQAVEGLSSCLAKHGAVIMELNTEDAALVRCALESSKLYFRTRAQMGGSVQPWPGAGFSKMAGYISTASRDAYHYHAGRSLLGEDVEHQPPCMPDVFRCLGKASRIALGAISRQLRLRSDAFYSLLDDCPLLEDDTSSSVLVATQFHNSGSSSKGCLGADGYSQECEKGLLTLIASDCPGLQVCDTNGRWYLADIGLRAGDLLLMLGRSLQHVTGGLRRACTYRVVPLSPTAIPGSSGRTSLTYRLMPRGDATLDGSAMGDAGHMVSEGYGPVMFSKFMEGLSIVEPSAGNEPANPSEVKGRYILEPSLRSILSDPLTGKILEDAFTSLGCGHSFGGGSLTRVTETRTCSTCGAAVDLGRVIPNFALRAAAAAYKREESRRQSQIASRKRRREMADHDDRAGAGSPTNYNGSRQFKGVQYPFNVNERVRIKGNKRTPEKFMGREAVVTSKCLNGWYLLRTLDNGESVRLQYRSLEKSISDENGIEDHAKQQIHGQLNS